MCSNIINEKRVKKNNEVEKEEGKTHSFRFIAFRPTAKLDYKASGNVLKIDGEICVCVWRERLRIFLFATKDFFFV